MSQHVLVAVDGSEEAERAFEYVLDELVEPTVTLVHVVTPVSSASYGDEEYFDVESFQREAERRRERGRELLETYRERAEDRGVEAAVVLAMGRPAVEILALAAEEEVDHIAMGSRGRSGVERILFGSVAEAVTRRAEVPVTITR